jgi:predicted lipoprotein with Yx(FWY)xxD motif
VQAATTPLGDVLVNADGRTLYLFTKDAGGKSSCAGACADTWPALTVSADPTAGSGADAGKLGTVMRDDGTKQVTYAGSPLYTYAPDKKAGDTNGQGVGGVWFAVTPEGKAVGASAATTTAALGSSY